MFSLRYKNIHFLNQSCYPFLSEARLVCDNGSSLGEKRSFGKQLANIDGPQHMFSLTFNLNYL